MTTVADPTIEEEFTIPDTSTGLEDFLADPKKMAALLKRKDGLQNFITAYAKVVLDKQVDIATQVQDEVDRAMAQFLKDQKEEGFVPVDQDWSTRMRSVPAGQSRSDFRNGLNNPKAIGAQLDKEFGGPFGLSEFFQLIWHNRNHDAQDQAKLRRIRNAFTSTEGAGGGFLIPEALRSELLRVALETAVVRPRARIVPMEALKVGWPAIDSDSNVSSVHGGIVASWDEESSTGTDTEPEFRTIELQARKLRTVTSVPNELIADSAVALQMFINELFPEALTFEEDYAFLAGDAIGKPLGSLNIDNPGTIEVAPEAGQGAATIVWENIIKMYSRMLPASINRAVWVVSHDTFPELATMALSVGTGGVPVWLPDGTGAPQLTLLGRPVIPTEKTPAALGTRGDISFWDPGFYLVGDRQMMSASSSEHSKFLEDQTAFKIITRVDGRPWLSNTITPRNQGPTLGGTVQLATRS